MQKNRAEVMNPSTETVQISIFPDLYKSIRQSKRRCPKCGATRDYIISIPGRKWKCLMLNCGFEWDRPPRIKRPKEEKEKLPMRPKVEKRLQRLPGGLFHTGAPIMRPGRRR